MQAKTAEGVPQYDIVKNRHGKKYFAKVIKVAKDQSWRQVAMFITMKCLETGSKPSVGVPVLDGVASVRPVVPKPLKSDAIQFHQSRLQKNL